MLGPLYEKCKNEGVTIEELQKHINNLFKEGKCKSCKVEDFKDLCKLKSSSNSFFDLVEKTKNLNIIRNFIDEYPDCLSEKSFSKDDQSDIDTPLMYLLDINGSKINKNTEDLIEYILLKYPHKCDLTFRGNLNSAFIHRLIYKENVKLLDILLQVGKDIGAEKIGLDLLIDYPVPYDYNIPTMTKCDINPLMLCFSTVSRFKLFYKSMIYMLDNFSSKQLNLRGDNSNISTLLFISASLYSNSKYIFGNTNIKNVYNIIVKILSFGSEECALNRAIPHIGTFFSSIFSFNFISSSTIQVSDLWKELSKFSADELNVGYLYSIDEDESQKITQRTLSAFTECVRNLSSVDTMNIPLEMIEKYGDKLNFEAIVSYGKEPATVLQFCITKYIELISKGIISNKISKSLSKAIVKMINDYTEKCNIGYVNKYSYTTFKQFDFEYTALELLLITERMEKEQLDIVEALISLGPKTINFNHITPENTYLYNTYISKFNINTTNMIKLIKFCGSYKMKFIDELDVEEEEEQIIIVTETSRLNSLLIKCFDWDLADNLLDYPNPDNNYRYSLLGCCILGKFSEASIDLLRRGAEFNKLDVLYRVDTAGREFIVTHIIMSIVKDLPEVATRILDFTNEQINLGYQNNLGWSALSLSHEKFYPELEERIRERLGIDEEKEAEDPEWFRQLPRQAQAEAVHQRAKIVVVDKKLKQLLSYPYILDLDEATKTFSKAINGRIKEKDIYECEEKTYGFGDIHDQAVLRRIPADRKVSACKLFQAIWSIIYNIKDTETKKDMTQRLEEEMSACVKKGICSTGWVTRLINVLVGFDEQINKSLEIDEEEEKEMDVGTVIFNYKNRFEKMLQTEIDKRFETMSEEESDEIMDEMTMAFDDQIKYRRIKEEVGEELKKEIMEQLKNVEEEVVDEAIKEMIKMV
jgi:hypothetical protein